MAQLQEMIPKLAAIALERLVFSGAGPAEVQTLVQRQNSTIWLSEAFITYAWCTQKGLFDYFRSKPVFREDPHSQLTAESPYWRAPEEKQPEGGYLKQTLQGNSIERPLYRDDEKILRENDAAIALLSSQPIGENRHIYVTGEFVDHVALQGPDSFELLLSSRGREVEVTRNVVQSLSQCGADVVQMVLRHPQVKITEAITNETLRQGLEATKALLDKRGNEIQITEEVIKEAAIYSESSSEMARLLLSENANVIITRSLLAAVDRWFGEKVMESLIKEKGLRIEVTSQVLRAIRWAGGDVGMIEGVLGSTARATEDLVNLLAWAYEGGFMRLLFDRQVGAVTVTEETVRCAAHNRVGGYMLELLLNQQPSGYKITEEVIIAAAGNPDFGREMIRLLLIQRWNEVVVTERVIAAAKRNENVSEGKAIIELLHSRQKQDRGILSRKRDFFRGTI